MWLQFTRRTYCQISLISDPQTRSKVRLLSMIKNEEIFLVQLATRPFPKHIYMSHTYDLLFPFLLSSFLFSSSSSSSVFALSFFKTKMSYLFWSSLYLILSPFYFTFQGGNFLPLSFKPLVSSTIFFLILF